MKRLLALFVLLVISFLIVGGAYITLSRKWSAHPEDYLLGVWLVLAMLICGIVGWRAIQRLRDGGR